MVRVLHKNVIKGEKEKGDESEYDLLVDGGGDGGGVRKTLRSFVRLEV